MCKAVALPLFRKAPLYCYLYWPDGCRVLFVRGGLGEILVEASCRCGDLVSTKPSKISASVETSAQQSAPQT